ncbi:hypothetical protein L6270_01450 [Candidatus Parcubacteria bacterium]|nr:hypothetical protein [Patescibacteria group bacterium]MBU4309805.1 hypothetical protein [Patescibacteria group bacterium]MBU4432201.1 hypothetical protein [Patescibacteria group bacterium]MBU4578144.1 hypothetical protein [Patescibacteria group bacterium]MCG2696681.1 hypothetical protein [Candidatus Parcubacteria bacterium]
MENNYYGVYAVLALLPIWATIVIFYLLTLFVVDAGRERFEGFSYNVSHAARYGDIGLLVIIIIGSTILQRCPELSGFIATNKFQFLCGFVSGVIAGGMFGAEVVMHSKGVERQIVDIYHNLFILPFFVGLLLALFRLLYFMGQ